VTDANSENACEFNGETDVTLTPGLGEDDGMVEGTI
jgi:hypothetical protein